MKNIKIFCFSGTGNTAFVVDALQKALVGRGMEVTLIPLEQLYFAKDAEAVKDCDLVGIAFPVHGFNPPWLVEKTFKQHHLPPGKKYFIIKTAGDPFIYGGTTDRLQRILSRKSWKLQYEALVPMPANLFLRYADSFMKLNVKMAVKQAGKIAEDLIEGDTKILPASQLARLLAFVCKIEAFGARWGGRFWKVTDRCIKCGKCVANCPTRNISFKDGKFKFSGHCVLCLKCSFNCPVQAYSHKHLGSRFWIKPYNLNLIIEDVNIAETQLEDDNNSTVTGFSRFWWRQGIID
jgi:ferredoxin/flavodoxin